MLFGKELKDITEEDIYKIEKDPINFESFEIEYKERFDGGAGELRRDIVQFANGNTIGHILYGISNDPIQVVGIEKNEIDILKNILNDVLPKKIDPILSPFPLFQPIPLSNGKYILIIEIVPKSYGVYGIRLHEDLTNRNYKRYEFYNRMDGSKHQMNIEEIVELIESKSRGKKKILEVSIHSNVLISNFDDIFILVEAVNKSERPIVVKSYGIYLPEKEYVVYISAIHPKLSLINSKLPKKLLDGEDCRAYIERPAFKEIIKKEGWSYPLKVQGVFDTNDGKFYSDEIILKEIK